MTRNHICRDCGARFPCLPNTPGHYYRFSSHWRSCDPRTLKRQIEAARTCPKYAAYLFGSVVLMAIG